MINEYFAVPYCLSSQRILKSFTNCGPNPAIRSMLEEPWAYMEPHWQLAPGSIHMDSIEYRALNLQLHHPRLKCSMVVCVVEQEYKYSLLEKIDLSYIRQYYSDTTQYAKTNFIQPPGLLYQ